MIDWGRRGVSPYRSLWSRRVQGEFDFLRAGRCARRILKQLVDEGIHIVTETGQELLCGKLLRGDCLVHSTTQTFRQPSKQVYISRSA